MPELGPHDITMVFRTLVLYALSLLVIRLMGKRSVAQLSPFDFMVLIIIGSAIAIPMEDEQIPLVHGMIPILTILLINYVLYWLIQKNRKIEDFLQGTSTILVRDGRVMLDNLKEERITLADLLILLREKGVESIKEVKEATIEPNGTMSMIKKKENQPLSRQDLGGMIPLGSTMPVIVGGRIIQENLSKSGLSRSDLNSALKEGGYVFQQVEDAVVDEAGRVLVIKSNPPPPYMPNILGLKEVKDRYKIDLNLLLDAFSLDLTDQEIASVSNVGTETIAELRSIMGAQEVPFGLTVGEKRALMDEDR